MSAGKVKKSFYIALGCLCLTLGTIGVAVPVLPTAPFYLVTAWCFARSSERLNSSFRSTKLYEKHLRSYVERKGMKRSTKAGILVCVSLLMGLGFFLMARRGIWVPCAILALVWLGHVISFGFCVKTIR